MEITLIIVCGIVLVSIAGVVGDYLTKANLAKAASNPEAVARLEQRVAELERKIHDQDAKIVLLENDVTFTTKLLQDKK